ncbi:Glycerophosphodiester phosphodiesterase [Defluviimonas aquaemixtae]|uniref:Glycerophosphodiester phosphodiesterase n=1 Tax=Albidovulum aquaemixtae TaxID=1542388 RepID=A0A2R8B350_9RHOB|nr:glycerophosphodiester phosphodiesterase family protein [Defluviimonas aquaemixtae]SPH16982.1 Glycerophosphodiester phosphodiesterase [Defluviimonas aquaemixtae]
MANASRSPFLDHPLPIAFAHRGGALEVEENTMPAFSHAVGLGYSHVETDVQATRDGVAVIFHDDTLERMAGRPDRIDALSWAELSRHRTRGGAEIPRLDAFLDAFPGLFVNLEAKSDAAVGPMAEAIRRADAVARICVGSFEPERTARLRRALGPKLAWSPAHAGVFRLWLAGWGVPLTRGAFPAVQVPTHFKSIPVVTRRFVRAARARGIQVHVWTVDDEVGMEALIDIGVDGLMTDRPTLLKQVLERRGLWRQRAAPG